MNSYQKTLQKREEQHLLRKLPPVSDGIDFFSNDYLGFAGDQKLHQKITERAARRADGNGSTGSRLLSGNNDYKEQIEQEIADFHEVEAALVYPSGYAANIGLISSLATRETTLILDELVHASLIDGARLGKSTRKVFKHNDCEDLEKLLQSTSGQKLVIIESIYSMDGDTSPIAEMIKMCKKHDAFLLVDEAHGVGVFGDKGEGLLQQQRLHKEVLARIITYGKAPGIHGASVVGPRWLKEYQVNFSRSLIFSTAPDDTHFTAISAMYSHMEQAVEQREKLRDVVRYFIGKREKSKGVWLDSRSHIQSLIVAGNSEVITLSDRLRTAGLNALPIRKPSVPEGQERIRICLHAYNTEDEIDLLFNTL
ncbi:MAG: 8-amino-7-oxononanoate synthase [Bacteroidota bacterium]